MHTELTSQTLLEQVQVTETSAAERKKKQQAAALRDLSLSLENCHVWLMLGYQDIKLRYRRSVLGPFWITLSMAISVYTMGFLYGHLFHNDLGSYYPFLCAGMLAWALISSSITEIAESFTSAEHLIKQIKLPYSMYVHRIIWRNILIFFHNLIVIVPILVFCHQSAHINWHTLLLFPHLLLFYINAFSYGLILAIIGARYRDLSQMVKSLVQVAFFLTPIMWDPSLLPAQYQFWVPYNPFYDFAQLIRQPLVGGSLTWFEYGMIGTMTIVGIFAALSLFSKYRTRIVYWL